MVVADLARTHIFVYVWKTDAGVTSIADEVGLPQSWAPFKIDKGLYSDLFRTRNSSTDICMK